MRRSQQAVENFEAALTRAEEEAAQALEMVNNGRLAEAQKAKKAAAAVARQEAKAAAGEAGAQEEEEEEGGEEEEIGEGDWERASEESLAKALEEAKEAVNHARSYLIGELAECRCQCQCQFETYGLWSRAITSWCVLWSYRIGELAECECQCQVNVNANERRAVLQYLIGVLGCAGCAIILLRYLITMVCPQLLATEVLERAIYDISLPFFFPRQAYLGHSSVGCGVVGDVDIACAVRYTGGCFSNE